MNNLFRFYGAYILKFDQLSEGYAIKDKNGKLINKKYSYFDKIALLIKKAKIDETSYRYVRFFKDEIINEGVRVYFGTLVGNELNNVLNSVSIKPDLSECYLVKFQDGFVLFEDNEKNKFFMKFENNGYRMEMLARDLTSNQERVLCFDYYKFPHHFFVND